MGSYPIFYITTPCLNASEYVNETIASVVSQAGNFAIYYHVQDGGSTDGTLELLQAWDELLSTHPPLIACKKVHFSWNSEPDNGMYDAINKGFSHLNPPDSGIMAWVNSDDPYLPRAFSTVCRFFETLPSAEWVGGKVMWLGEDGGLSNISGYDYYPNKMILHGLTATGQWWCVQQNGCFWKGSLWRKAGPLDSSLHYAADAYLWPRFAAHAIFHHFPVYLGQFRCVDGQLSSSKVYHDEIFARFSLRKYLLRYIFPISSAARYISFRASTRVLYLRQKMFTWAALALIGKLIFFPVRSRLAAIKKLFSI